MPEHPLKIYEDLDPKLLQLVNNTKDLALADGALPRKVKLLIAMVLDAVHGASDGCAVARPRGDTGLGNQGRDCRGVTCCPIHLWRGLYLHSG